MTVLDARTHNHHAPTLLSNMRGYRAVPRLDRVSKPARAWSWLSNHTKQLKTYAFGLVAFGSPTLAAFEWHAWAGLIALGLAAFLFDASTNPSAPAVDEMTGVDADVTAQ